MKRALMLAVAALGFAPAVAQAHTDDLAKPILFVSGPDVLNCTQYGPMKAAFDKYSTSAKGTPVKLAATMTTVGVNGSDGCDGTLPSGSAASIDQLGDQLATWISGRYDTKTIDVVAFGQAGLVLRSALAQRPKLHIEDAVTIGTPHAGSALHRNPQGAGGTDWSVIGSASDSVVPGASAVDMDAAHRTLYGRFTHEQLLTDSAPNKRDMVIQYAHDGSEFKPSTTAPHPVQRVADDLVFGGDGAAGGCALAATMPGECGVTPIILLPGFGASELVCTEDDNSTTDMWPGAVKVGTRFETMALSETGVGPADRTSACATSIRPTGNAVQSVLGAKIHEFSSAWIRRMGGAHGYVFGWDFRKGPDKTIPRLDQYIDWVLKQHGATKVALVAHSYGGLLARWYVDDPAHAKKVARVANFGSPFWGAPKAWFAIAYGYETPKFEKSDMIVYNGFFKTWTKNLTGIYYLLPPQAWFNGMPGQLSSWLEINGRPVGNANAAAVWIGSDTAANGNETLARSVAENHRLHVDGFTTQGGTVDWRIFVGSGLASMGHVRASTSKDVDPQYSWFNGDGTVPLVSQRQSASASGKQLGDQVKTYNFCGVKHMEEMETQPIQDAVAPFIVSGADPVVDGTVLRNQPCPLASTEFRVTGDEDQASQDLSVISEAVGARASSAAHAAQAPATPMTLQEANDAGLIDLAKTPHGLIFTTSTTKPLTFTGSGEGTVQVTALTGDAKTGASRVYELSSTPITIVAKGAQASSTARSTPADRTPPKTTASFQRGKLRVKAKDAGGVAVTYVQVGKQAPKVYKRPMRVARKGKVHVWSVDKAGNSERRRVVKR